MTDDADDADLEAQINGFLTALGERPQELIPKHLAEIQQPNPQDADDVRRYVSDLKIVYGQGLIDMYRRVESHGTAICGLTDEAEITERVQKIMALVARDGEDVPKILASFQDAANQLTPLAIVRLFMTIQAASAGGVPRQAQRDALILDLTAYCLTRFPLSDDE
jgi:putative component of toxin-antitoxin plasmid stabilization module